MQNLPFRLAGADRGTGRMYHMQNLPFRLAGADRGTGRMYHMQNLTRSVTAAPNGRFCMITIRAGSPGHLHSTSRRLRSGRNSCPARAATPTQRTSATAAATRSTSSSQTGRCRGTRPTARRPHRPARGATRPAAAVRPRRRSRPAWRVRVIRSASSDSDIQAYRPRPSLTNVSTSAPAIPVRSTSSGSHAGRSAGGSSARASAYAAAITAVRGPTASATALIIATARVEVGHAAQPDLHVSSAAQLGAACRQRRGVREVREVTQGDAHRHRSTDCPHHIGQTDCPHHIGQTDCPHHIGQTDCPHHIGQDEWRRRTERPLGRILDVDDVGSPGHGVPRLLDRHDADQQLHAAACPAPSRAIQAPRRSKSTTRTSVAGRTTARSRSARSIARSGPSTIP